MSALAAVRRWFLPELVPAELARSEAAMRQAEAAEQEACSRLQETRKVIGSRYAPRSGEVAKIVQELDDADAAMMEALGDDET